MKIVTKRCFFDPADTQADNLFSQDSSLREREKQLYNNLFPPSVLSTFRIFFFLFLCLDDSYDA